MHGLALARALESHAREQALLAGFRATREAYFLEYTDATEFDGEFEAALRKVWEVCFPQDTSDGDDFDTFFGPTERGEED